MPRVNPTHILNCLKSLLTPSGGIKNDQDIPQVALLMETFSNSLVSKCIYLLILKATDQPLLEKFMDNKGWFLIHSWMSHAVEAKNYPILVEILDFVLSCPLNVQSLLANNTAILIKKLSKDTRVPRQVRELASNIVKHWLNILKNTPPVSIQDPSSAAVEIRHTSPPTVHKDTPHPGSVPQVHVKVERTENDTTAGSVDCPEQKYPTVGADNSPSSNNNRISSSPSARSSSSYEEVDSYVPPAANIKDESPVDEDEFSDENERSNGEIVESGSLKTEIEKDDDDGTPSTTKKTANEGPEEQRPAKEDKEQDGVSKLTHERREKEKSKDWGDVNETTFPVLETLDSTNLVSNPAESLGGIPKVVDAENVSTTSLHDNNEEGKEATKSSDGDDVEPSKKVVKKSTTVSPSMPAVSMSVEKLSPGEGRPKTAKVYSSKPRLTGLEQELSSVILRKIPAAAAAKRKSSSKQASLSNDTDEPTEKLVPPWEKKDKSSTVSNKSPKKGVDHKKNESVVSKPNIQVKRSSFASKTKNRPKKSVTWKNDDTLISLQYFEVDATERTNVYRNFMEMQRMEKCNERNDFLYRRRAKNDNMVEQISWTTPVPISGIEVKGTIPGTKSVEKEHQYDKDSSGLFMKYVGRRSISDTPFEIDLEFQAVSNPPIIPLDDGSQDSVHDFSDKKWPEPKQYYPSTGNDDVVNPVHKLVSSSTLTPFKQKFIGRAKPIPTPMSLENDWDINNNEIPGASKIPVSSNATKGLTPPKNISPTTGDDIVSSSSDVINNRSNNRGTNDNSSPNSSHHSLSSSSEYESSSKRAKIDDDSHTERESRKNDQDGSNSRDYNRGNWRGGYSNKSRILCRNTKNNGYCRVTGCRFFHPEKTIQRIKDSRAIDDMAMAAEISDIYQCSADLKCNRQSHDYNDDNEFVFVSNGVEELAKDREFKWQSIRSEYNSLWSHHGPNEIEYSVTFSDIPFDLPLVYQVAYTRRYYAINYKEVPTLVNSISDRGFQLYIRADGFEAENRDSDNVFAAFDSVVARVDTAVDGPRTLSLKLKLRQRKLMSKRNKTVNMSGNLKPLFITSTYSMEVAVDADDDDELKNAWLDYLDNVATPTKITRVQSNWIKICRQRYEEPLLQKACIFDEYRISKREHIKPKSREDDRSAEPSLTQWHVECESRSLMFDTFDKALRDIRSSLNNSEEICCLFNSAKANFTSDLSPVLSTKQFDDVNNMCRTYVECICAVAFYKELLYDNYDTDCVRSKQNLYKKLVACTQLKATHRGVSVREFRNKNGEIDNHVYTSLCCFNLIA